MPEICFISDLHLSDSEPDLTTLFVQFLNTRAREVDQLYILGDLFDAWIGDDDESPLITTCSKALKACAASTPIFLQHGNRDFLIGKRFADAAGITLLKDQFVLDLFGTPTLLLHGDLLCTDDVNYQQVRTMIRAPQWQQQFLAQDIATRKRQVSEYRKASGEHQKLQTADIIDANPHTVATMMQQQQVSQLIHGHTHRPAVHRFELAGQPATRYVLAQWQGQQAHALLATEQGIAATTWTSP